MKTCSICSSVEQIPARRTRTTAVPDIATGSGASATKRSWSPSQIRARTSPSKRDVAQQTLALLLDQRALEALVGLIGDGVCLVGKARCLIRETLGLVRRTLCP